MVETERKPSFLFFNNYQILSAIVTSTHISFPPPCLYIALLYFFLTFFLNYPEFLCDLVSYLRAIISFFNNTINNPRYRSLNTSVFR